MSTIEIIMAIINVAAIITVPIAAVFVGQKLQDRNQKRKDKMAIFQCLMTHRATGWAHQDTVNALNTIVHKLFPSPKTVVNVTFWGAEELLLAAQSQPEHKLNLPLAENPINIGTHCDYIALVNIAKYYCKQLKYQIVKRILTQSIKVLLEIQIHSIREKRLQLLSMHVT